MRILIDIGHPAQVHQFKHVYALLKQNGHEVVFTAKDKEIAHYLLDVYDIPYYTIGASKKGYLNKVLSIPRVCWQFAKVLRIFKPDMGVSRFSFQASWMVFLFGKKHVALTDTEHVGVADKLTVPFVNAKLTAYSYQKELGKNHIRYNGNIELFYLHPNRFAPNKSIYKDLGITANEQYAIVRFVSWDAHHDVGLSGITLENKIRLVQELSKLMRVFITSEKKLPKELKPYQISIKPECMHDAIAFSSLLVGESATMASEAAVLGVPSVYIDEVGRGYTDEEGEYGLVYNYKPSEQDKAIDKALEVAKEMAQGGGVVYKHKHQEFLKDKIDPTAFLVWFVENYPESRDIMKKDPDYQYRFK